MVRIFVAKTPSDSMHSVLVAYMKSLRRSSCTNTRFANFVQYFD